MADAYEAGLALGQEAYRAGQNRRIADRRSDVDERRQAVDERQQKEAELTGAIDRRRLTSMAEDLEMTAKVKKDEMQRLIEAESAWTKFSTAEQSIDWANPDAPKQYEAISASYIPSILKHEAVTRKFEAYDKVTKQNTAYTAKKVTEAQTASGMAEAARIAPELLIDPPKKPDGSLDATEFGRRLKDRRNELLVETERLRQSYRTPARAPAKRRVYMSEVDRALLDSEKKNLQTVSDQMTAMDMQGARQKGKPADMDRYRNLDIERQRIIGRIKALGDKYPQGTEPEETTTPGEDTRTPATPDGRPAEDVDDTDPLNLFGRKP